MKSDDSHCYFIATSWNDAPVSLHFRALASRLAARGHRVVMLVDGRKREAEDHAGNPAVYTWPSRRPVKLRDALFLLRLALRHRPACLVANFGASNVMMLVGWLLGVRRRVLWYHTVSAAIDLDAKGASWKTRALRLRKRFVYGAATHVVPASAAGLEDVRGVFGVPADKCRVFYNSLEDPLAKPERAQPKGGSAAVRETLARESDAVEPQTRRLVCVGRLFPTKGQDVLIRALALLKERAPCVRIEFLGGGPEEGTLRKLAREVSVEDACEFAGAVSHAEVLRRVARADATVVPSRSDNCPLVVIESLALGVPLVASKVGGIVETIDEGVEGFLVPPDDAAALADRLAALLTDEGLRRRMGGAARARFLAQFEQGRVVAEQVRWFEGVVAHAAAQGVAAVENSGAV